MHSTLGPQNCNVYVEFKYGGIILKISPVEAAASDNLEIMVLGPIKTLIVLLLLSWLFNGTETENRSGWLMFRDGSTVEISRHVTFAVVL